jgi:hypothetical protein
MKTDGVIESIVRKVENTGVELSHYSGKKSELTVGGGTHAYFYTSSITAM